MTQLQDNKINYVRQEHAPIIDCPEKVKANEIFHIKIKVGIEDGHPDNFDHHIRRISLYYYDNEGKIVRQVASVDFTRRNSNAEDLNDYETIISTKVNYSGVFHAMAYCNLHGLWESTKEVTVM